VLLLERRDVSMKNVVAGALRVRATVVREHADNVALLEERREPLVMDVYLPVLDRSGVLPALRGFAMYASPKIRGELGPLTGYAPPRRGRGGAR
jgi:hypothetical protein